VPLAKMKSIPGNKRSMGKHKLSDVTRIQLMIVSAWARFNQGTRCFKGLMGYESVFRWYIGAAIDSMIADKIMYTELRPMLMDKSIPSDDGLRRLDHRAQMDIILQEVAKKQNELEDQGNLDLFPFGLKIIYCAPRSIPKARMNIEMLDCIQLKLVYPDLICGKRYKSVL
jgi:adenosine deaminase CECR1